MIRFIAEVVLPLLWFGWTVAATYLWLQERRKRASVEAPWLQLPRRKRRKYVQELLDEKHMDWLTKQLNERTQLPHEK